MPTASLVVVALPPLGQFNATLHRREGDGYTSNYLLPSATQAARGELQAGLALAEGAGSFVADWEVSEMRCQLACVYRACGGELWAERQHAHALLLQAAAVEGPAQVRLAHTYLATCAR